MSVASTVLFDVPQKEIASLIVDRISRSSAVSIVTGFATPGGLASIAAPITTQPKRLKTLVVGAATYPGFAALDDLIAAGVPVDRLHVHLGHTSQTGGRKNPFARYHPMLHSKVYYMELAGSAACAFIGSHNLTSYALAGLNGEAAVLLEGSVDSPEFGKIRNHVNAAQKQAIKYSPAMKDAFAWWTREFIDGLRAEMGVPVDWTATRTILLFASAAAADRPKGGDHLYFEIPAGIEHIQSLATETHLFLFDPLPTTPWEALLKAGSASAHYKCRTIGVENQQGNIELVANWRIDGTRPVLTQVPSGLYRPSPPSGKQQVRAEVETPILPSFEYLFERERTGWDPEYSMDEPLKITHDADKTAFDEAQGGKNRMHTWKLVKGLFPRQGPALEKDAAALKLASPESGAFVLVSLRRRRRNSPPHHETES